MKRSLTLRREALSELSATDLAAVAGGGLPSGLTCPLDDCFASRLGTCNCWSSTC